MPKVAAQKVAKIEIFRREVELAYCDRQSYLLRRRRRRSR
jgi:hypothetical protein